MTAAEDLALLRRTLDEAEAAHPGAEEAVGLLLATVERPSGYDATPEGLIPFAWTGGDGVHFSQAPGGGPVTMTVPMAFDGENVIVGRDLRAFLSLGLRTGYFVLEQLAYDRAAMLARLKTGDPLDEVAEATLDRIAAAFGIAPPDDPAALLDAAL